MNSIQQNIDFLLQKVKDLVEAHFGLPGVIVLSVVMTLLFLWIFWKQVVKVPGVSWLVGVFKRAPLPLFEPGVFGVLVADLENDSKNGAGASGLRSSIASKTEGVTVVRLNRRIDGMGKGTPSSVAKAQKNAHRYLEKTQAQVLVWGLVHTAGKEKELELFIDHLGEKGEAKPKPFRYEKGIFIKEEFYSDMINVLAMTITSRYTMFQELQKQEMVSLVEPHAKACREFLRNEYLPPSRRADVRQHLAKTLCTLAQHTDTIRLLGEAVELQKANLAEVSRDDDPERWAQAQDSLGVALLELGRQEIEQDRLKEAVAAFSTALEIRTRDTLLVPWVVTQTHLAQALIELGGRNLEYAPINAAINLLREVLEDITLEQHPEEWATIKFLLGTANIVQRFSDESESILADAYRVLQEVFAVWTRERHPQQWANSKHELGVILRNIGARDVSINRFEESAQALRGALEVRTRARVPLEWAESNNALGETLYRLGEREVDNKLLLDALTTHQEVLEVVTPEMAPRQWALTLALLARVRDDLSYRFGGEELPRESVENFRQVLLVVTKDNDAARWHSFGHWFAHALRRCGEVTKDAILLDEALSVCNELIKHQEIKLCQFALAHNVMLSGDILWTRYVVSNSVRDMEDALVANKSALELFKAYGSEYLQAWATLNIGTIYEAKASRKQSKRSIETSIRALLEAWNVFREGNLYVAKHCCDKIVTALHILATYPNDVHLAVIEKYQSELNKARVWAFHNHVDFPWELVMGPEPDTDS